MDAVRARRCHLEDSLERSAQGQRLPIAADKHVNNALPQLIRIEAKRVRGLPAGAQKHSCQKHTERHVLRRGQVLVVHQFALDHDGHGLRVRQILQARALVGRLVGDIERDLAPGQ